MAAMKMSYGLDYFECLSQDLLNKVKRAGFDGIDFYFTGHGYSEDKYERRLRELDFGKIRESIDKAGLVCKQVHLPCCALFDSCEIYDDSLEDNLMYAISVMKELGAEWGAVHAVSAVNADFNSKKAYHDNVERLKKYREVAEKYEVGIAVENIPTFPDHPEYPFYSSKAEEHCELIDSMDSPLVKACWDFGHTNINAQCVTEEEKEKALLMLGNRIKIVHAHSNYGTRDSHLPPAIGNVNWNHMLPLLWSTGFTGYFNLECSKHNTTEAIRDAYIEFCGKSTTAIIEEAKKHEI